MNNDLRIDYPLLINAIKQNIDTKQSEIDSLLDEIDNLEIQIKHLEKLIDSENKPNNSVRSERKFRWSDMVMEAFNSYQAFMTKETLIGIVLRNNTEIEEEYKPSIYNHRISTALKNHLKKDTIVKKESVLANEPLYYLPNWVEENTLKKKQFDRFILDNFNLTEYGLNNEEYIDSAGYLTKYPAPF